MELKNFIKEEWKRKVAQYGLSNPDSITKPSENSEKTLESHIETSESLDESSDDSSWLNLIKTNSRTKRYILGRVVYGLYS